MELQLNVSCERPIEQHRYSLARLAVLKRERVCWAGCGKPLGRKIATHHVIPRFVFTAEPRPKPSKDVGCWNHHENLVLMHIECHRKLHQKRKRWSQRGWLNAKRKPVS